MVVKNGEETQVMNEVAAVSDQFDDYDECLYLLGRPTLKRFLRYVRNHAVSPQDTASLCSEWQAANSLTHDLETEEAGIADQPPIQQMGTEYEPLLIEFLKDPLVRSGFNTVPTDVAIVELDRLVVFQKNIDLTYARQLEQRLGPAPSIETIFKTCLPYDHPQPPVKSLRVRRNSFTFMSPSNDLRFLGSMELKANNVTDYSPPGDLVGVLGLAVGFGSNFLNATYVGKRLILNNGSHRAYTLRKMGITHVPCVIEHVDSRHELELVATSDVVDHQSFFLRNPRPSMLKDYFNPLLHKIMPVHRRLRQVTLRFEVEETFVPAF